MKFDKKLNWFFNTLGVILLLAAGIMYYEATKDRTAEIAVPVSYQYEINQNVSPSVRYQTNSFYENQTPGINTTYITQLTEAINSQFYYKFTGSKTTSLQYTYSVKATVRALESLNSGNATQSTVWTKDFQLVSPITKSVNTKSFSLNPNVTVPFSEYKTLVDQLNSTLNLSLKGQVIITSSVYVTGVIDGNSFADTRISTVTAPLSGELYTLSTNFDKQDTGQVAAKVEDGWTIFGHINEIIAGIMAVVGVAALAYGLRSATPRSKYQRELDKIYRYHRSVIVRVHKTPNFKGKNIIAVKSFADLLNLEEELKVPIVASPSSSRSTHFIIIYNDMVYVYTLRDLSSRNKKPTNKTPTDNYIGGQFDRFIQPLQNTSMRNNSIHNNKDM